MSHCIPPATVTAVHKRAGSRCEDCGRKGPLELHRLRYVTPASDPIYGHETPDDLALLCRDCHHDRHIDRNGECWADAVAMADAWFGYEHKDDRKPLRLWLSQRCQHLLFGRNVGH